MYSDKNFEVIKNITVLIQSGRKICEFAVTN